MFGDCPFGELLADEGSATLLPSWLHISWRKKKTNFVKGNLMS